MRLVPGLEGGYPAALPGVWEAVVIRRKPRRDPVTPAIALAVFARDQGCVAPRLGGSAMDCWGRNRIEHVKEEPRMDRRGSLLVTLCQGHTEDGMRAGYVWATDAENRRRMRDYVASVTPPNADPLTLDEVAS